MYNLPNQDPVIIFVNAQGRNEMTDDPNTLYRNRRYEEYLEVLATPADDARSKHIEELFSCIISTNLFLEPVITPGGHTYEKQAIEAWIDRSATDPYTREPLSKDQLRDNNEIKKLTENFITNNHVLEPRSRGFQRDPRTINDVLDNFQERILAIFSGASAAALAPAALATYGTLECAQGNSTIGSASIVGGTLLGLSYAAHAAPVATAIAGSAVVASAAATVEASADASTVCYQSSEPSSSVSCT